MNEWKEPRFKMRVEGPPGGHFEIRKGGGRIYRCPCGGLTKAPNPARDGAIELVCDCGNVFRVTVA